MSNNIHIIKHEGKPTFVVLPYEEYQDLIAKQPLSEEMEYKVALERAKEEEHFPEEVVKRVLGGESPIKVFREYRNISQQELADKIGKSKQYISEIERGNRKGAAKTLKDIAVELRLDLEDLI